VHTFIQKIHQSDMNIQVFENKIIAPNKCGTRYLRLIFEHKQFTHLFLPKIKGKTYFIIREPLEHLKSALHTELLGVKDTIEFDKKFNRFLSETGTIHYVNNLYQIIYFYKEKNPNCKIVELHNLSDLLMDLGYNIPYNKWNYNLSTEYADWWVNKDTFFSKLKHKYPTQVGILENWIKIQNEYYDLLIENKIKKNSLI